MADRKREKQAAINFSKETSAPSAKAADKPVAKKPAPKKKVYGAKYAEPKGATPPMKLADADKRVAGSVRITGKTPGQNAAAERVAAAKAKGEATRSSGAAQAAKPLPNRKPRTTATPQERARATAKSIITGVELKGLKKQAKRGKK